MFHENDDESLGGRLGGKATRRSLHEVVGLSLNTLLARSYPATFARSVQAVRRIRSPFALTLLELHAVRGLEKMTPLQKESRLSVNRFRRRS